MKKILLALLFTTTCFGLCYSAEKLVYRETFKEKTAISKYILTKTNDGYSIISSNNTGTGKIESDASYHTFSGKYDLSMYKDRLIIKRKGNSLVFLMGDKKDKEEKIDDAPWYGSYILLRGFALSDEKEGLHFLVIPENKSVMKLRNIKEGTEEITVNGNKVVSLRIRTTLPDWLGMFWSSYYWYRLSDGILVKTKETRGPPGTPDTIMELISEEATAD